jgi:hypothetical protein
MKKIHIIAALFAASLLAGCSTAKTNQPGSEAELAAKSFEAPAAGAAIYVYRARGSHFGAHELMLEVDGKSLSTMPACYFRMEHKPGTVTLKAKHADLLGGEQEISVPVSVGDVKVFEFKPIARFLVPGESKLLPVDPVTAKALVAEQQLCNTQTFVF